MINYFEQVMTGLSALATDLAEEMDCQPEDLCGVVLEDGAQAVKVMGRRGRPRLFRARNEDEAMAVKIHAPLEAIATPMATIQEGPVEAVFYWDNIFGGFATIAQKAAVALNCEPELLRASLGVDGKQLVRIAGKKGRPRSVGPGFFPEVANEFVPSITFAEGRRSSNQEAVDEMEVPGTPVHLPAHFLEEKPVKEWKPKLVNRDLPVIAKPTSLGELEGVARKRAIALGHQPGEFRRISQSVFISNCRKCGMSVVGDTRGIEARYLPPLTPSNYLMGVLFTSSCEAASAVKIQAEAAAAQVAG